LSFNNSNASAKQSSCLRRESGSNAHSENQTTITK
jgi:hypothetical protein